MGLCVFSLPISLVMMERIYALFYYHHQIGSMIYWPLFRVKPWNNGMRCMSLHILLDKRIILSVVNGVFVKSTFQVLHTFLSKVPIHGKGAVILRWKGPHNFSLFFKHSSWHQSHKTNIVSTIFTTRPWHITKPEGIILSPNTASRHSVLEAMHPHTVCEKPYSSTVSASASTSTVTTSKGFIVEEQWKPINKHIGAYM